MAGYVCTVAGGNGGVGKTTTTINIAAVLEERGYDTAVIDADLAMPNVAEMLNAEYKRCLHDILAGNSTISETLTEAPGGMTIIPGEPSLEAYAEADPTKLRKVTRTLKDIYDVVLIDTAAGLSKETTVPMEIADGVILVTIPDHVSLTDTGKTGKIADLVESNIVGALITRLTRDTPMSDIQAEFDYPVLGGIPNDLDVIGNEPVSIESPNSEPADAYQELTTELERVFFEGAAAGDLHKIPHSWYT
jgi:septum site-determining protein MinD